jgi:hypothetical protein
MKYSTEYLLSAHDASFASKESILLSNVCGCFYCLSTFPPDEITEWVLERDNTETAVCPKCNIDSVVGSSSDFPVEDKEFLEAMNEHWFS